MIMKIAVPVTSDKYIDGTNMKAITMKDIIMTDMYATIIKETFRM